MNGLDTAEVPAVRMDSRPGLPLRVLDVFSGIGGFSLGLERAGMRTVAFCEVEPYPRAVLAERWPGVPIYGDIRELTAARLAADGVAVDLICGGFPCQDISVAGKRAGIDGERSGLWSEYARLVDEIRPLYVIVENVAALLNRGIERVLGDLAALGYDAEWHCIPASAVGAPHRRDRVWIVAYPNGDRRNAGSENEEGTEGATFDATRASGERRKDSPRAEALAHADEPRLQGWLRRILQERGAERLARESGSPVGDAASQGLPDWAGGEVGQPFPITQFERPSGREVELDFRGVPHGVSSRVDRLTALGNAVVPEIPEILGLAIMTMHATDSRTSGT